MKKVNYVIKTKDGQTVRKRATKAYIAGFINRDLSGKVVKVKDLTTKPKSKFYYAGKGWFYEKLIHEEVFS